ncbi:MAG: type II toxin-antitoxin system PemK/MazF family toxin [Myxococcales bacterium]|nr:type II toxin-antitoxin system PemK/MazF family toxin [Myxococcales bacterium]
MNVREISRGDLYWVEETSSSGELRSHPYLVLQDDVFNRSRLSTVVVCALSTRMKLASEAGNVLLDEGEGNLPRRSVIVVSQLESFERAKLGDKIGALSEVRVEQALSGLRFQQRSMSRR